MFRSCKTAHAWQIYVYIVKYVFPVGNVDKPVHDYIHELVNVLKNSITRIDRVAFTLQLLGVHYSGHAEQLLMFDLIALISISWTDLLMMWSIVIKCTQMYSFTIEKLYVIHFAYSMHEVTLNVNHLEEASSSYSSSSSWIFSLSSLLSSGPLLYIYWVINLFICTLMHNW